jgi:hypothetical protein
MTTKDVADTVAMVWAMFIVLGSLFYGVWKMFCLEGAAVFPIIGLLALTTWSVYWVAFKL